MKKNKRRNYTDEFKKAAINKSSKQIFITAKSTELFCNKIRSALLNNYDVTYYAKRKSDFNGAGT